MCVKSILKKHMVYFYEISHIVSTLKRINPTRLESIYTDLDKYSEEEIVKDINSTDIEALSKSDKERYLISMYYVANDLSLG